MKVGKVALVFFAAAALVLAEPPVPSSQYLPSNQYGPPNNQYGPPRPFSPPSNQYGAPAQTTAIVRPNNQYGAPRPGGNYLPPGQGNGGYGGNGGGYGGGGYDDQSEPANYNFEYHVQDAQSGNDFGHQESRQGDVAQGKYYVLLPDGRRQTVEYIADNEGYKPKISYEQVSNGIGGGYANGGYPSGGGGNGGYQY
nr:PREDICTED: cuticle protein isoform X1 [Tribolium castaneum]|eukprot:XP_008190752.1 PREDICTED: cuticle protein isoform X1 [Tribolium castaneum]